MMRPERVDEQPYGEKARYVSDGEVDRQQADGRAGRQASKQAGEQAGRSKQTRHFPCYPFHAGGWNEHARSDM